MTGEQLFLRYAFPCAEILLGAGKINSEQHREILRLVKTGEDPSREFLRACYKKPVTELEWYLDQHLSDAWALWPVELVAQFWRREHFGPSPVSIREIRRLDGHFAYFEIDEHICRAFNLYELELQVGDRVSTHQDCIIEKVEE